MNKKSIAKNSIYNMIYSGFRVFFPLVSISYFSRILTAEGIGKIEYAYTVVNYFLIIAALGIPAYGVKNIARAGNNFTKRSRVFWEMFYLNFFSTLLCALIYYIFITVNEYFAGRRILFYVMGSLLIFNIANIDWYYQGVEDYAYITKRSISIKIFSFILMVIFVKNYNDYLIYAVILCLASVGNYIFNMFYLRKQIKFLSLKECHISRHIKANFILLGSVLATEIYTMLDSVILEYFHGEIYVGYYSNSVKIVRMVYTLSTAMVAAFYPRISLYIKENKFEETNELISKGCKILIIFAFPAAIGLFLTADTIIPVLLGNSFMPSILCLKLLSILVIVISFAAALGHIVLIASGNEGRVLLATICGAVINAALNFLLIPAYKHYGAAFASVIAEIIVTFVLLKKSMKIINVHVEKSFILSVLISLIIMICSIKFIDFLEISLLLRLILYILVGMITYFSSLILLKNQAMLYFYSRVCSQKQTTQK